MRENTRKKSGKKKFLWILPIAGIIIAILFIYNRQSNIQVSNPNVKYGSFTDARDGKTYKTVKIGNQTWMAENLAHKTNKGCWAYDNDQSNVTKYGYLYNWETAKIVCPTGWHLPTKSEFKTLLDNYSNGNDIVGNRKANYKALISGNNSGFLDSLGGFRSDGGNYYEIGKACSFWSSTPVGDSFANELSIESSNKFVYVFHYFRNWGFHVRCLQD